MALPRDENGFEIVRGDLILSDGEVFKVVDWTEGLAGDCHLDLVNAKKSCTVMSHRVTCLGKDTISTMPKSKVAAKSKKNGKGKQLGAGTQARSKKKKPKLKSGDWVRQIADGRCGHIVEVLGSGVSVECWTSGIAATSWWAVDACEKIDPNDLTSREKFGTPPSRSELDSAFGPPSSGGGFEVSAVKGSILAGEDDWLERYDRRSESRGMGRGSHLDEDGYCSDCRCKPCQCDYRISLRGGGGGAYRGGYGSQKRPPTKPQKRDNISKQDLIMDEVQRLNKERRDKTMGKEDEKSKPKLKTRKGDW